MLDANFRLKSKDRGFADTQLSPGWSYFVERDKYWAHIKTYGEQSEVCRLCSMGTAPYNESRLAHVRPNSRRCAKSTRGKTAILLRAQEHVCVLAMP